MKEHPIIFSTDMARAILDGRKTQTRRIIKPQPTEDCCRSTYLHHCRSNLWEWRYKEKPQTCVGKLEGVKCPYKVGDRLWVRETMLKALRQGWYKADRTHAIGTWKWKTNTLSARFMPRWAARIILEITDIKAERIGDITTKGCIAEGYPPQKIDPAAIMFGWWEKLWISIHGKDIWDKNPWVWRITFRKLSKDATDGKNRTTKTG